ncbi:MAG TPA: hypothetical protein VGB17_15030 [Pyrinomonadaceae bacterium]|jgi:hypothetical protein
MRCLLINPARLLAASFALLVLLATAGPSVQAQTQARTPTETVREFYKAMSERRFREAFAMSTLRPAVEGLSAAEFEDLRPEFERMIGMAGKVLVSGEQVSGDLATVFIKMSDADPADPPEEVSLMRVGGKWVIGDQESLSAASQDGKQYFFKLRINTHHSEVQSMLQRIMLAEAAFSQQHNGQFADMQALIAAGYIPKDLEGTETTGYRFHISLSPDKKSYTAGAEPAVYGRTGRLSFFLDQSGIRSGDTGGKPLSLPPSK